MPAPPLFPIDSIRQDMAEPRPWRDAPWLAKSWSAAEDLQQALIDYSASLHAPPAKSGSAGVDLYHDTVLRFAMTDRVALRWLVRLGDGERIVRSLSYAELHDRASVLAQQLREQGLKPGDPVCILLAPSDWLLVALFACLRIGVVVSVISPRGQQYVARRVKASKTAIILTDKLYAKLCPVGGPPSLLVGARDDEGLRRGLPDDRSHTYGPAAPVFLQPAPLRDPPAQLVPVPAQQAYSAALRDGLLLFGLKPGDGLCAPLPDFDPAQYYPALILATLLTGATFVLCDAAALAKDPALVPRLGITCLGLSNGLRDGLRKLPAAACAPLSRLHLWFRNALEPLDVATWRDLDTRCALAQVLRLQLIYEAAHGGALVVSSRYKGDASLLVWPAPGHPWKLAPVDVMGSTQATAVSHGLFLPTGWKKNQAFLILAKANSSVGDGYFVGGLLGPRRCGQVFPQAEVGEALASVRGVVGVSGLAIPEGSEPLRWTFVVLVFLGGNPQAADLRTQLEQQISFAVGSEYQPDHVEIFPLYPKRLGPSDKPLSTRPIDHAWCQSRYLMGALQQKTTRHSVQRLTALRAAVLQLPNAPAAGPDPGSDSSL